MLRHSGDKRFHSRRAATRVSDAVTVSHAYRLGCRVSLFITLEESDDTLLVRSWLRIFTMLRASLVTVILMAVGDTA